jgi:hypothetical protein
MEQAEERYYLIGLGSTEDWQAGRGSLYFVERNNGEKWLVIFTTPEAAERHIRANFNQPTAHIEMLESLPATHAGPLTEGRFVVMEAGIYEVAERALEMGIDYLQRDIRPGSNQEVIRVPK